MKFKVGKASDDSYKEELEFNSVEEIMEFIIEIDEPIVIDKKKRIIIYDDYLE